MKMMNKKFLIVLSAFVLSSCDSSSFQIKEQLGFSDNASNLTKNALLIEPESFVRVNSGLLIEPEKFIANKQDQVNSTALTGPVVAMEMVNKGILSTNERREINKEERKNYTEVASSDLNKVFPITVNFENITIEDMSVMFAEITGRNILIGNEVSGLVSAKLNDVPWDKALDSILKIENLAKYVDEEANIIRIHSQEVLVAQEEFDLKRIQDMDKLRDAERTIEPLYTEIFKLYYTTADQVSKEVISVINGSAVDADGAASGTGIEITIDERLNYLIVKATKEELDFIATIISEVDVRTKQVLIEAFVVEASEDLGKALGATFGITEPEGSVLGGRFDGTDGNFANLAASAANGFLNPANTVNLILGTTTENLALALQASESQGVTKILSNPRVFTLDGQKAVIKQTDEVPYTVVEDGVASIELKEAGIILTVTPVIVGDGNIILTVEVEKSSVDITIANPPLAKRTITTKLLIKDETIVVIGGVFTQKTVDTQQKTPLIGDLPFIGNLFRKDQSTDIRKELLVFLAPRII
jgi:type IV pilus assembly protein PilQ